jgi:hypothetical protein
MSLVIQNVIVTLVALGAAIILVRRVMGWRRQTAAGQPSCPSCEAGEPCTPKPDASIGAPKTHPLILVRSKRGD